jgi:NADPH:quinone reductase-like Zn-dependent oxidoreductase
VAAHLIGNVRDGGRIASIVPVPDGANAGDRVTIHELYHQTDAKTLDAVIDDAAKGRLVIPIAQIFTLDQIGAAQNAVAAGAKGKIVLKH